MFRLHGGAYAWWITGRGEVVRVICLSRRGRNWLVLRCDVGYHLYLARLELPRSELFGNWYDAENYARVVRQWIAEEEGVIDLAEGL